MGTPFCLTNRRGLLIFSGDVSPDPTIYKRTTVMEYWYQFASVYTQRSELPSLFPG